MYILYYIYNYRMQYLAENILKRLIEPFALKMDLMSKNFRGMIFYYFKSISFSTRMLLTLKVLLALQHHV